MTFAKSLRPAAPRYRVAARTAAVFLAFGLLAGCGPSCGGGWKDGECTSWGVGHGNAPWWI